MAFLTSQVSVRVPATTANLGPGFDCLGIALSLYDLVSAQVCGESVHVDVSGEGQGDLPSGETHLIAKTMIAGFESLGTVPPGFQLKCENSIPQARGLGSSSAAIVAGILLARGLVVGGAERMPDAAMLELAAEIEGHPDNVAPCLLGGATIAWEESVAGHMLARARTVPKVEQVLQPVVFVPENRGYTAQARAALPSEVPLKDASFNVARTAMLVAVLFGETDLLFKATDDRLHQPYRRAVMPDTIDLIGKLRENDIAAVVSGAGPTVLALVPAGDDDAAKEAMNQCPAGWFTKSLSIATGAHIVSA